MDDTEDDARYPPNPYSNPNHRFPPSRPTTKPFNRVPVAALAPQIARPYADDDEDDDDDDEDPADRPRIPDDDDEDDDDEPEDRPGPAFQRIRGFGDGPNENDDEESSEESRGKRRRLDRFEFAPRVPPPAPVPTPSVPQAPAPVSKPFARNPLADWSEDETFVLLEAWGDRYVQNGRKSLRSEEWNEVSKRVCQSSRIKRTDAQCRNRVDTLKKKYKKEKAKLSGSGNSGSNWIYFKKMDVLMSAPVVLPQPVVHQQMMQHEVQQQLPPRLPCGVDAGEYVFTNSRIYGRVNDNDEMRDSPGDTGTEDDADDDNEDDSDGLPPRRENASRGSDSSFRMLADSIQKFGEIYEKMENNKRQQMAELERMRKEFQRDLEVQKRQILERAQAEIAKMREEEGDEDDEDDKDDEDDDDDDGDGDGDDNGGSAENLSGFLAGSVYLTVFT